MNRHLSRISSWNVGRTICMWKMKASWIYGPVKKSKEQPEKSPTDVICGKWAVYEWRQNERTRNMGTGGDRERRKILLCELRAAFERVSRNDESKFAQAMKFDNFRLKIVFHVEWKTFLRCPRPHCDIRQITINLQLLWSNVSAKRSRSINRVLSWERSVWLLYAALTEPRQRDLSTAFCRFHCQQIHSWLNIFRRLRWLKRLDNKG